MAAQVETPAFRVSTTTTTEAASAYSYLESRLAAPNVSAAPPTSFSIPIIDISPSFSSDLSKRQKVAEAINAACTSSGFFYITGHGIPASTCSAALKLAERFFKELPQEKKQALHMSQSSLHRGWEPAEFTSLYGDAETKEAFNWGYEAALDPTGGDGKYTELDGSTGNGNVWPSEADLPGFYAGVKDYYSSVLQLARHLFRLFALSLSLSEDHFDRMMTHPGGISRIIYYPPASKPLHAEQTSEEIGLGAHSDYECFTILLSSSTPGLEILSPNGTWISAPMVEDGLVVNVADFLMRWTNDVYKSTVHRVVNRSTTEERYSLPFFFSINYDEMVDVCESDIA